MNNQSITFYVAECMEFTALGAYYDNIKSLDEAVRIYESIPDERLNGAKGIGFELSDGDSFDLLSNDAIEPAIINLMPQFRDNELVQKAISDISKIYPDKVRR